MLLRIIKATMMSWSKQYNIVMDPKMARRQQTRCGNKWTVFIMANGSTVKWHQTTSGFMFNFVIINLGKR